MALTSVGAGRRHLGIATSRPSGVRWCPRPPTGVTMVGQAAAAEFAGPGRVCLCTGAQQPNNSLCSRGHVASHVRGAVSAGVLAHLFSALSGLSGAGPSPRRQPAPWPEITSTNLPGRSGVALLLCRLAMCFSLQGVSTGKDVSCVWFSVGGSGTSYRPRPCAASGLGRGITTCCPPLPLPPPLLRHHNTTTRALVLLVSFIQCQDCFKKFPWPQFKQEYSWDVLDFRQSALNLR